MKKTLIALAVLAASGASMAQVTLYGVADASIAGTSTPGLNLTNQNGQVNTSKQLNNGNSRFGLKGTEDLGGGLKANFNFEAGLGLSDGASVGGQLFARAANMSLSGGFGSIQIGRALTTSFLSVASWELTGMANYSAVASQFNMGGAGPRDNNVIKYDTVNMSGFTGSLSFIPEGNAAYGTAAAPKSKYDVSAGYSAGPLVASLAYNKVADGNEGVVLGGAYNFGSFKIAGSYNQVKNGGGSIIADGVTLGASIPVGQWTFTADVANDTKWNDTDFLLEAKYALSKRTFVYGVYLRDGTSSNARPVATASNPGNKDIDGYSIGLRHNF